MNDEGERATLLGPDLALLEGPEGKRVVRYTRAALDKPTPEGATLFVHDSDGYFRPTRGPAKISSQAYRQGWDALFGKKEIGLA
jgi:hypothetical protein